MAFVYKLCEIKKKWYRVNEVFIGLKWSFYWIILWTLLFSGGNKNLAGDISWSVENEQIFGKLGGGTGGKTL